MNAQITIGPRLPIELCLHILEAYSPPSSVLYIPKEGERQRIHTLVACARVCRDWIDYVRRHLYHIAWVATPHGLSCFIATLQSRPPLALLVKQVVVTPSQWMKIGAPLDEYLQITPLLDRSPIERLAFVNYRWDQGKWPDYYLKRIGHSGDTIVSLQLSAVFLPSQLQFLHLLRSFRNLIDLYLHGVHFDKPLTNDRIVRLEAERPSWASASLRVLEIGGAQGLPAVHLLGSAIHTFRLGVHIGNSIDDPILNDYCSCVARYRSLNILRITFHPWTEYPPSGDADHGAQVWHPIHEYLQRVLGAVQSSAVHTLQIALAPQQQDPRAVVKTEHHEGVSRNTSSTSSCRYRHTRGGVLDTVFAQDVRDILLSSEFASLARIQLRVLDNSYAENWWQPQIVTRLHGFPPGVQIKVDVRPEIDRTSPMLWDE